MNRPVHQAMRGLPNQNFQNRNMQMGNSRMPNGKSGASQWGFGMPSSVAGGGGSGSAAPGLPNPQPRGGPGASSNFAQTIGSSQNTASLDPSEFPSLSTNQQQQYSNASQAVWANQRPAQQAAIQRPQHAQQAAPGSVQTPQQTTHHGQEQTQQGLNEDFFSSNIGNGMDEYRQSNQSGLGQLQSSGNPQTGSVDDFPPLGRMGPGEIGQDRRMAMLQSAAGSGFSGNSAFAPGNSRTPGDMLRQGQDKNGAPTPLQNGNSDSLFAGHNDPQSTQRGFSAEQNGSRFPSDGADAGDAANPKSPAQMTTLEKFGLPGLLDTIRSENPDVSSLAIGHDLTTLGLDLNSSEPLYPAFGGPFASFPTRPLQPDFVLPPCYAVANTHPIDEKITSLGDETLFWIFYTVTRDLLQEQAAAELYSRNWRYHKDMGVWLTKEPTYDPQSLGLEAERGRYIVFNPKVWQKESKDMILYYADLDTHLQSQPGGGVPY